jgi:class 3 adenylate cyclase
VAKETNPADDEEPTLERRLATILSADVAGYTRLMGENEEATVKTLRAHRAVFEALLKQHHGRVFNTAGDAILAEFPSAVEAVRCATEIQTALQTRNEHLPPELKMLFRMGINLGDVVVQEGDLLGDGVNVAARIQTVAEPGGICISGSVYDQIQNKLSLQFRPLGEQQFKNVGQPVRTFTITHGEKGALPSSIRRMGANTLRNLGIAGIAGAALIAAGFWLYRSSETNRSEQSVLSTQLEAEKKAAVEARKTAEEQSRRAQDAEAKAERERIVAEAAKREAALQLQLQSAEGARARAEAERKRLDDDRQRAEATQRAAETRAAEEKRAAEARAAEEKRAAEARAEEKKSRRVEASAGPSAGTKVAAAAPGANVAGGTNKFDGTYLGEMCNFPDDPSRRLCWNPPLVVENGVAAATWPSRVPGKATRSRTTIAANSTARMDVDGWNASNGMPLTAVLEGRAADNRIDLKGAWNNKGSVPIEGHWTRTQ